MSAKEPNDIGPEMYSDLIDGKHLYSPLTDDLDPDVDAEWLDQQQEAAFKAAEDAGCFEVTKEYEGDLIADCNAVSLRDKVLRIHTDHVFLMQLDQGTSQFLECGRDEAMAEANTNGFFAMRGAGR